MPTPLPKPPLELTRTLIWSTSDPLGMELADLHLDRAATTLVAWGAAIGSAPEPYRVEYALRTGAAYVTERLVVHTRGHDWNRTLELTRAADGRWTCVTEVAGDVALPPPGGLLGGLAEAFDCDLAYSPLTNAMPILRHDLHRGGGGAAIEVLVAWVSLPDLAVTPVVQQYAAGARPGQVRFAVREPAFRAVLELDDDGLVTDYPGLARRVV